MYANKVNPIAFIPNRGLVVFGQKTLAPTASALDRINVARLIVYLRYQLDLIAKPFLFEPNDRITRDQVTDTFNRFLEDLTAKRALFDFLVVCDETNNTDTRIDKNELWIDIAIQPIKAVEFIYIPLRIKNTGESLTS
jgi:phage tail sheath protein FI